MGYFPMSLEINFLFIFGLEPDRRNWKINMMSDNPPAMLGYLASIDIAGGRR
jgi:hypothetical protein